MSANCVAFSDVQVNVKDGVAKYTWKDWPQISGSWEKLHSKTPQAFFFTSKAWVSNWLATFGESLNPEIYFWNCDGSTRAAWILVRRAANWHGLPIRQVFFGTSGENDADTPWVEYNGFVFDPVYFGEALSEVWRAINREAWDELHLNGLQPELAGVIIGDRAARERLLPVPGIDLDAIRGTEYLKHLSHNTRMQLRKSYKFYGRRGELAVDVAQTPDEALAMLNELAVLHEATWQKRGKPGVFVSEKFNEFHRRLIVSWPEHTQLLRVRAGEETIGLLYNFVYDGVVHTYQCGFHYEEGNQNARPGLVVTSYAVEHALTNASIRYFDLMEGTGRYKQSLSTQEAKLGWYVVPGITGRSRLREGLRRVANTAAKVLEKSRSKTQERSESKSETRA